MIIYVKIICSNKWTSSDVDVLVLMVANEAQAESVLYGEAGSVSGITGYPFVHYTNCA